MRTVLKNTIINNAPTFVTIELVQFAKNGYEITSTFDSINSMKPTVVSHTVSPSSYHATVVYNREINALKAKGYVIETKED